MFGTTSIPSITPPPARYLRHWILLVTSFALLAGCGFHLRGAVELPPALARVHVNGADRDLVERLSDALARRGAAVDSATGAARVDLRESRFERRVLTTDARGRATAYVLRYRVVFDVTGGDGTLLQSAESVSLERAFDYDPERELQAEQEARFLQSEMRREAVTRILNRLARL